MPAAGTRHTEDASRRIRLTTSASMREHWRTPHGQDVQLRRREARLRDSAIPHSEERVSFWRAKRESLEAELEGIVERRRELAEGRIARSRGYLEATAGEVRHEQLRRARA